MIRLLLVFLFSSALARCGDLLSTTYTIADLSPYDQSFVAITIGEVASRHDLVNRYRETSDLAIFAYYAGKGSIEASKRNGRGIVRVNYSPSGARDFADIDTFLRSAFTQHFGPRFGVTAGTLVPSEYTLCFFRGLVVPISNPRPVRVFPLGFDDRFRLRLRVHEILAGGGPIAVGNDYVFGLHSIVLVFTNHEVADVEGKEFIWLLKTSKLKDGSELVHLMRGEDMYESMKGNFIQPPKPASPPALSPPNGPVAAANHP